MDAGPVLAAGARGLGVLGPQTPPRLRRRPRQRPARRCDAQLEPHAPPAADRRPPQAGDDALRRRITELEAEVAASKPRPPATATVELDDERILQEVGIYRYHHPLENAAEYKDAAQRAQRQIKDMVKAGDAVLASDMFTFNNSLAKGRQDDRRVLQADAARLQRRGRQLRAGTARRQRRHGQESPRVIGRPPSPSSAR